MAEIILDRGQDPGVDGALAASRAIGAGGWMAYLGGPGLYFAPWSIGTVRGLLAAGQGILPVVTFGISVDDTTRLLDVYGFPRGCPVMLDIEYWEGTAPSVGVWDDGVRRAGYLPIAYANPDGLVTYGYLSDAAPAGVIAADYPYGIGNLPSPLPDGSWIPGLSDQAWPGMRGWQFSNEVDLAGLLVDVSVIQFPLATTAPNLPGGRMVFDPSGRLHTPYVSGGHVWLASAAGTDDFFHGKADIQDLGGPPSGAVPGTEQAAWSGALQLRVQGNDGQLYGWYGDLAGHSLGWLPLLYTGANGTGPIAADLPPRGATGPQGPVGPQGPSGDTGPQGVPGTALPTGTKLTVTVG